ncbi:MAG TPA: DUF3098 domain-containing protein [Paludibacteraceae bacterium]|nr:DUF3098 domain-containing protein [Paludibacteraceae bacterium]HPT43494.1 DUF3098 domain-containing protein [Paludibacteraceae bacterium]
MENKKFGLSKINFILIAVALLVIIIGFLLMTGKPSGVEFNPDIFGTRRIIVGPMISFIGFISMIAGILYTPKNKN